VIGLTLAAGVNAIFKSASRANQPSAGILSAV